MSAEPEPLEPGQEQEWPPRVSRNRTVASEALLPGNHGPGDGTFGGLYRIPGGETPKLKPFHISVCTNSVHASYGRAIGAQLEQIRPRQERRRGTSSARRQPGPALRTLYVDVVHPTSRVTRLPARTFLASRYQEV